MTCSHPSKWNKCTQVTKLMDKYFNAILKKTKDLLLQSHVIQLSITTKSSSDLVRHDAIPASNIGNSEGEKAEDKLNGLAQVELGECHSKTYDVQHF